MISVSSEAEREREMGGVVGHGKEGAPCIE